MGRERPLRTPWVDHPHIHGGEIAGLKGLQGGIGWAESDEFPCAVAVQDLSAVGGDAIAGLLCSPGRCAGNGLCSL